MFDFAAEQLEGATDRLDFDDFYLAYERAAREQKKRALTPDDFMAPFERLCREGGIHVEYRGEKLYLANVRLAPAATFSPVGTA